MVDNYTDRSEARVRTRTNVGRNALRRVTGCQHHKGDHSQRLPQTKKTFHGQIRVRVFYLTERDPGQYLFLTFR